MLRAPRVEELYRYHPHVNVTVRVRRKEYPWGKVALKDYVPKDQLARIKERWAAGLRRLGCECPEGKAVPVRVGFKTGRLGVMHEIKYVTHPPDRRFMAAWGRRGVPAELADKGVRLRYLFAVQLKGWNWIRYWGALSSSRYGEEDLGEDAALKGVQRVLAEEGLEKVGIISQQQFEAMRARKDLEWETLSEGFWRMKERVAAASSLADGHRVRRYVLRVTPKKAKEGDGTDRVRLE